MLYKGHTITWPWAIDIRIPLYRTDFFQQAGVQVPTTWAEFRAAAKKLTGNGKYGLVESGADPSFDLNDRLAPGSGWVLSEALAVNADGVIVGDGYQNSEFGVFRLTPAP